MLKKLPQFIILAILISSSILSFPVSADAVGTCYDDNMNKAVVLAEFPNQNNYIKEPTEVQVTFNLDYLPKNRKYRVLVSNGLSNSVVNNATGGIISGVFNDDDYSQLISYDDIQNKGSININNRSHVTYTFTTEGKAVKPGVHELKLHTDQGQVCDRLNHVTLLNKQLRTAACTIEINHSFVSAGKPFDIKISIPGSVAAYNYEFFIVKQQKSNIAGISPDTADANTLNGATRGALARFRLTPTPQNSDIQINYPNNGSKTNLTGPASALDPGIYTALVKVGIPGTDSSAYGFFCNALQFEVNNKDNSSTPPLKANPLTPPSVGTGTKPANPNNAQAKPPSSPIPATGEQCFKDKDKKIPIEGTINTAIGCVRTDPVGLVQDFFKLAIGIGGGIALLLMILGAFQMITSAGNPEGVKAGKEQFTSAIEGLLFIIFAVLLLRIIGVDILGFGQFLGVTK